MLGTVTYVVATITIVVKKQHIFGNTWILKFPLVTNLSRFSGILRSSAPLTKYDSWMSMLINDQIICRRIFRLSSPHSSCVRLKLRSFHPEHSFFLPLRDIKASDVISRWGGLSTKLPLVATPKEEIHDTALSWITLNKPHSLSWTRKPF